MKWTPAGGGATEPVRGLGWIADQVVIRKNDDSVVAVALSELDSASRKTLFQARLEDHSGKKLVESEIWIYHYPKDWTETQQSYHHGFTFVQKKDGGDPQLFLRSFSTRFQGMPIDSASLPVEGQTEVVTIPIEARLTRKHEASNGVYSIVTTRLASAEIQSLLPLADDADITLVLRSGPNNTTINLNEEDRAASREALCLYSWAVGLR